MLVQYNQAFPGCAERIVAMAERQSAHRQYLEKTVIESGIVAQTRGQRYALILALSVVAGGVYLIMNDKPTAGLTAIITALVSLVGVFIYGKLAQRKELDRKKVELVK